MDDMAPGLLSEDLPDRSQSNKGANESKAYPEPLKLSGALDGFKYEDTTPAIGREFLDINIVDDILNAEDADARLRDLAINSAPTNPSHI